MSIRSKVDRAAPVPDGTKTARSAKAARTIGETPPWLETNEGDAPVLLIAPHGGQAGPASRALLHPKVNDLHTADITRELSDRLSASAIINSGMDRNRLDLNRLSQVMDAAPWMLELIAGRLERIVERHSRATVLLVHGWNVIEPRVDLGVGLKSLGGMLRPPRGAHISASESFINGALIGFIERLRRDGIKVSFGLRYPGGAANNLLQAFTQRHAMSPVAALRRLAALNACGALEAVQLELSVALRLPGRLRHATLEAITEVFSRHDSHVPAPRGRQVTITHADEAKPASHAALSHSAARPAPPSGKSPHAASSPASTAAPARVGIEFYDPGAQVGVLASFDLGPRAAGARVMVLLGRERIALFTAEGRVEHTTHHLALGPLMLSAQGGRLVFEFHGPAVVVDDGSAYLSVERALAGAALHDAMKLRAEFDPWPMAHPGSAPDGAAMLELLADPGPVADAVFGRVTGCLAIAGTTHSLSAVGRAGRSFAGIGGGGFRARRMVWAAFADDAAPRAIEARIVLDDGSDHPSARLFDRGSWIPQDLRALEMHPAASTRRPPRRISAVLGEHPGELALGAEVGSFVMLSRPGPAQSRIVTSLGFASFGLGGHRGAGMFERSERSARASVSTADAGQNDDD